MAKCIYIDTHSGIAGDMLLASLIDAGADINELKKKLSTITAISGEWDLKVNHEARSNGQIFGKYIVVATY